MAEAPDVAAALERLRARCESRPEPIRTLYLDDLALVAQALADAQREANEAAELHLADEQTIRNIDRRLAVAEQRAEEVEASKEPLADAAAHVVEITNRVTSAGLSVPASLAMAIEILAALLADAQREVLEQAAKHADCCVDRQDLAELTAQVAERDAQLADLRANGMTAVETMEARIESAEAERDVWEKRCRLLMGRLNDLWRSVHEMA